MHRDYRSYSREELIREEEELKKEYERFRAMNLSLTMTRGVPCREQVDLSEGMFQVIDSGAKCFSGKTDIRNYGMLDGIPEMKQIFAELLHVMPENVICGGNSSLNMMYDAVSRAMVFGTAPGFTPWSKQKELKFLCPVPGYDRHFAICEVFGIQMIPIEMTSCGPDMRAVKEYVENDPAVKGIWCVPKYSNPDGTVYSPETVRAFASLHPAAKDFRIFWDNAYCVHDLYEEIPLTDIFAECRSMGAKNMVYEFASTSKISFPGSGVACLVADEADILWAKKLLSFQTIGPDKINQKRHAAFFRNAEGIRAHMRKHAEILRPKFETVIGTLERELDGRGIAVFSRPRGGYFFSFDQTIGSVKRAVALTADAGVALTPAGSTFPYHDDPYDRNVRIAPTFPTTSELETACTLLSISVRIAACERLLGMS
ncbi:MAG: aminotransferase class I/II-fold pyridoxal phosphate-dependent enzyme [Clostridia bacterium]|nr:aminotransferase class I/II-fold pyridoxal phosphate-dependent enzyme [Clostridia bacterium]